MTPVYTLCVLGSGGDVSDCIDLFDCADDAHAIQAAKLRANGRAMELWRRDRLVERFPSSNRRAR
jgi:hypothetical protein